MDYCINCGADLTDDMERCPECGAARLGRRPAPFTPKYYKESVEEPLSESAPVQPYIPQEPQEEVLRDQPAPVASGHEPGEPVSVDVDLSDVEKLSQVIDSVTQEAKPVAQSVADPIQSQLEDYEEYYDDPAYDVLTTGQYFGTVLLMGVPVIGWLATLIWALGGTKNFNRRNLARGACLAFLLVVAVLGATGIAFYYFTPETFNDIYVRILTAIQNF